MSKTNRQSTLSALVLVALMLGLFAVPAYAGTGGSELQGIYDYFSGLVQGTGGKLIAVIALLGAIAVSGISMKVGGIGGLLFVVISAAFGVAFINSMITGVI